MRSRLDLEPKRIYVRDQTTRWGSCSTSGALSFSWRLVLAPPFVLDYLAAHEVAHLGHINHGPRFWGLVERTMPRHEEARTWLRKHGASLHRYGAEGMLPFPGRHLAQAQHRVARRARYCRRRMPNTRRIERLASGLVAGPCGAARAAAPITPSSAGDARAGQRQRRLVLMRVGHDVMPEHGGQRAAGHFASCASRRRCRSTRPPT